MKTPRAILLTAAALYAWIAPLHAAPLSDDSTSLQLVIDGNAFFTNNEHPKSTRINGYTLPGFYLRPHLDWSIDRRTTIQLGVNWLHFWGNRSPYDTDGKSLLGGLIDTAQPAMVVPWLQVQFKLADWATLIVGSLDNQDGHRLPLPLYNPERLYASEPEAGSQLKIKHPNLDADIWIDWQQYIWSRSSRQERLLFGFSAEPRIHFDGWQLYAPLCFMWQHLGGEGRIDTTIDKQQRCNAAIGIGIRTQVGEVSLSADCVAMLHWRECDSVGTLTYTTVAGQDILQSAPQDFQKGWGIYPRLQLQWRDLWMEASWWTGEKFVPIAGLFHYSNVSINTPNMTHDRIQVAAMRVRYNITEKPTFTLAIEGALYYYFPYKGNRIGFAKVDGQASLLHTYGLQARFSPRIRIFPN